MLLVEISQHPFYDENIRTEDSLLKVKVAINSDEVDFSVKLSQKQNKAAILLSQKQNKGAILKSWKEKVFCNTEQLNNLFTFL